MDARVVLPPCFAGLTASELSLCFAGPRAGYAARIAPVER